MLSLASIGFYGKLPWVGDFIARNIDFAQQQKIDHWLSDGLTGLRDQDDNWLDSYLSAPVCKFILPAGVWSQFPVCGAVMPSVDKVGRYFPFVLFFNVEHADILLSSRYLDGIADLLPDFLEHETFPDQISEYLLKNLNFPMVTSAAEEAEALNDFISINKETGCWWQLDDGDVSGFYSLPDRKLFIRLFGAAHSFCERSEA